MSSRIAGALVAIALASRAMIIVGPLVVTSGTATLSATLRQPSAAEQGQPVDAKANRAAAMKAVRHHLDSWRAEWRNSEMERRDANNPRALFWHCHVEDVKTDRKNPHVIQYHQRIPSLYSAFAVCPSWMLADQPVVNDESLEVDAPIAESRRAKVQASRSACGRTQRGRSAGSIR